MNHDDLTDQLARELHDRAGEMDGSSLGLAGVQGRARSIRRRRTATAVVGTVAAVGLIIPTAALATHGSGKPEPAPISHSVSPSQKPSQTPSKTTDAQQPAPGVLDVSDLPSGAPPAMDYVADGKLHLTDGSTYLLRTRHTPSQLVELADGSLVFHTRDAGGVGYVEIRDPDGTYHDPVRSDSDLSVNAAHSIVAWLTPSGQVTIFEGWASQPRPLGDPVPGTDLRIGPVTGSADVRPGHTGPDCRQSTCTVIVNAHDVGQPWEVGESGSQKLTDGGYLNVSDISRGGLTVGVTRITDLGSSCSTLLGGGEFQGFRTCKHTLVSFSPDEQLLLADPAYHDGIGNGVIAMYDLSGQRLFERHSTEDAQSFYPEATWEDDTHVLAPVFQDGTWSLVRVASDGVMEYAVPPAPGDESENPFVPTGGGLPG